MALHVERKSVNYTTKKDDHRESPTLDLKYHQRLSSITQQPPVLLLEDNSGIMFSLPDGFRPTDEKVVMLSTDP